MKIIRTTAERKTTRPVLLLPVPSLFWVSQNSSSNSISSYFLMVGDGNSEREVTKVYTGWHVVYIDTEHEFWEIK